MKCSIVFPLSWLVGIRCPTGGVQRGFAFHYWRGSDNVCPYCNRPFMNIQDLDEHWANDEPCKMSERWFQENIVKLREKKWAGQS